MYTLIPVAPQELRKHWSQVRPGLEHVREKATTEWIPEEVYAAIVTGNAQLYLVRTQADSRDCGFFVLTRKVELDGTPKCLIWVAYAEPGNWEAVDWALGEVERIAHSSHYSGTVLYSSRKGWIRRLAPHGYRVTEYKLEKEL